jgi:Protein of unknown function (DUF2975)
VPHTVSLPSAPASSAIDEIRSLSRPFATLFGFLFLSMLTVCVAFILAALFYSGASLRMTPDHTQLLIMPDLTEQVLASTIAIADMPLKTRLVGIVSLGMLQLGSLTMIFFQFRALFRLYERGIVFATDNVACIRRIGFWLIVWGAAPTIGHQLCELTGVYDEGWLRASSIAAVVLGGLLYVIGRVMNLGREIELERASFI